jgi:hypothetical protein
MSLRGAFFKSLPQQELSGGGNLEGADFFQTEIASLCLQGRLKTFTVTRRILSRKRVYFQGNEAGAQRWRNVLKELRVYVQSLAVQWYIDVYIDKRSLR